VFSEPNSIAARNILLQASKINIKCHVLVILEVSVEQDINPEGRDGAALPAGGRLDS